MPARTTPSTVACADRRIDRDRGQSTLLATAVVAVALLLVVGLGRLGAVALDRARARTAADAAALAGVVDAGAGAGAGRRAAAEVAARNGAVLTDFRVDGIAVEATVEVGDARASSRAERVLTADG